MRLIVVLLLPLLLAACYDTGGRRALIIHEKPVTDPVITEPPITYPEFPPPYISPIPLPRTKPVRVKPSPNYDRRLTRVEKRVTSLETRVNRMIRAHKTLAGKFRRIINKMVSQWSGTFDADSRK